MPNTEPVKMAPHHVEAEQSLIGSILIDPAVLDLVRGIVSPDDFFIVKHNWVYAAFLGLHDKDQPIDFLTVCNELESRGQLAEIGGAAFISNLINAVPTAIHAEGYARIVQEKSRRRALLGAASDIATMAYDEKQNIDQAEADALHLLSNRLRSDDGRIEPADKVAGNVLDLVLSWAGHPLSPGQVRGLATGYRTIDSALGGFDPATLIILAGRPGMGKSALGFGIAENVAARGLPVMAFSLEMASEQVIARMACGRARMNWQKVKQGITNQEPLDAMIHNTTALAALPISFCDKTDTTTAQIRARVSRMSVHRPPALVVVDHLALLGDRDDNEVRRIGSITWELKRIAKDFNLTVLALCQLSRGVELRQDKRPMLADLRESGRIEENADIVLMMYRDKYYNHDTDKGNEVEVIVRKHREGEANVTACLYYAEEFTRFYDLAAKSN